MINMFSRNGLASIDAAIAFSLLPLKTLFFLDQAIFARLKASITQLIFFPLILILVCFNVDITCLFCKFNFTLTNTEIFSSLFFNSLVCVCVTSQSVLQIFRFDFNIHVKLVAQVDMCVSFFILISIKSFFFYDIRFRFDFYVCCFCFIGLPLFTRFSLVLYFYSLLSSFPFRFVFPLKFFVFF